MSHEKSLKYAWAPRNDDWFCPTPSVVLKSFDHWGDVLICLLINTSAPSHWLKSVAWPVGPVLKFRDIPDCLYCAREKAGRGLRSIAHDRGLKNRALHSFESRLEKGTWDSSLIRLQSRQSLGTTLSPLSRLPTFRNIECHVFSERKRERERRWYPSSWTFTDEGQSPKNLSCLFGFYYSWFVFSSVCV